MFAKALVFFVRKARFPIVYPLRYVIPHATPKKNTTNTTIRFLQEMSGFLDTSVFPEEIKLRIDRSPRLGVGRKGSPRFVPICSDFTVFFRLFRYAFLVFLWVHWFVLICSDFFRFVPTCFQNKSEQIKETPFCRPLLQVPEMMVLEVHHRDLVDPVLGECLKKTLLYNKNSHFWPLNGHIYGFSSLCHHTYPTALCNVNAGPQSLLSTEMLQGNPNYESNAKSQNGNLLERKFCLLQWVYKDISFAQIAIHYQSSIAKFQKLFKCYFQGSGCFETVFCFQTGIWIWPGGGIRKGVTRGLRKV